MLLDPDDAAGVWNAILRRGAVPAGLAARDTLRTEVCYPLYGNELGTERGPIEAGLGWCCRSEGGYIGADAVAAVRAGGPAERLVPFVVERGVARPGNAVVGGGVVTSGTYSPSLEGGIGMAYLPAARAQPGAAIEIDVRGRRPRGPDRDAAAARPIDRSGPQTIRVRAMAEASYPPELLYHPEHDWARIEGDEATFGITWHAQERSARSCSSSRPRSARRSPSTSPTPRSSRSRPSRT